MFPFLTNFLQHHMAKSLKADIPTRSHTKGEQFVCGFKGCLKSFTIRGSLVAHKRIHTGERPYICNFEGCTASFTQSGHLTTHAMVHTRETPFICNVEGCNKAFSRNSTLKTHAMVHTREKPYLCTFGDCRSAFAQHGTLVTHKRTHTREKPFLCNVEGCNKAFSQRSSLGVHTRVHTGERPLACGFRGCNKAFADSGTLAKHKRIHTGERPFACEICDMTFTQSGGLVVHKRTHSCETPFVCEFPDCGKAFAQSSRLKAHKFYWHTREGNVRMKKAESRILSLLQKNPTISFKEQHTIDFKCIGADRDGDRCFIDFLIEIKDPSGSVTGYILLEVDEEQHQHYSVSCELRRMADVHRTLALEGNTLPLAFVRYNPDAHRSDGTPVRVLKKDREAKLVEMLNSWTFDRPFGVYYMYYDKIDNEPAVFEDMEYDPSFRDYYLGCI